MMREAFRVWKTNLECNDRKRLLRRLMGEVIRNRLTPRPWFDRWYQITLSMRARTFTNGARTGALMSLSTIAKRVIDRRLRNALHLWHRGGVQVLQRRRAAKWILRRSKLYEKRLKRTYHMCSRVVLSFVLSSPLFRRLFDTSYPLFHTHTQTNKHTHTQECLAQMACEKLHKTQFTKILQRLASVRVDMYSMPDFDVWEQKSNVSSKGNSTRSKAYTTTSYVLFEFTSLENIKPQSQ